MLGGFDTILTLTPAKALTNTRFVNKARTASAEFELGGEKVSAVCDIFLFRNFE